MVTDSDFPRQKLCRSLLYLGTVAAATHHGLTIPQGAVTWLKGGWLGTVSLATPFFITAAFCLLTLVVIALFLPLIKLID